MSKNDFDRGLKWGTENPRGAVHTILDELSEVLPSPKSKKYKSWERGRDLGEKRSRKHSQSLSDASGGVGSSGGADIGSFGAEIVFQIIIGATSIAIGYCAIWALEHAITFSALWWIALIVGVPAAIFAIRFLLTLVFTLGVIYCLFMIIQYFVKNLM